MKPMTCGLIVLALLAGCSSMSVQTDFAQGVDFSGFETFKYVESDKTLAASAPCPIRGSLPQSGGRWPAPA